MLRDYYRGPSVRRGSPQENQKVQAQLKRHEVVLSNGRINRWYMPNRYYLENFDLGNGKQFTLIVMDTDPFAAAKASVADQNIQMTFLQNALNTYFGVSSFILVAGHHDNEGILSLIL